MSLFSRLHSGASPRGPFGLTTEQLDRRWSIACFLLFLGATLYWVSLFMLVLTGTGCTRSLREHLPRPSAGHTAGRAAEDAVRPAAAGPAAGPVAGDECPGGVCTVPGAPPAMK